MMRDSKITGRRTRRPSPEAYEEDVGRVAGVGMDGGVGEASDGDLHLGGAALRKHGEIEGATVGPGPARDDDTEPGGPSRGVRQPWLSHPEAVALDGVGDLGAGDGAVHDPGCGDAAWAGASPCRPAPIRPDRLARCPVTA